MCKYQIWRIDITGEAICRKNEFGLFLAVKWVKETWLWWNLNLVCRATYRMYIPGFKVQIWKHVDKKAKKTFRWWGASSAGITLPSVCGQQRATNCPTMIQS